MYTMKLFNVFVICFRCFSYCFSKCLVSFVSNLGVILQSFWSFRIDYRALGCHWATLRSQHGSRVDPGSILRWLWKPLGHPSGSLCGPFGRPKDPRTEKKRRTRGCLFTSSIFWEVFFTFQVPWTPKNKNSVWERYAKPHFRPRPEKTRFWNDSGTV